MRSNLFSVSPVAVLIPYKNPGVLQRMNETSMFWITTRYALLMSAFVVLGRIFDQDPKSLHNIDKLLTAVSNDIGTLGKVGLAQRRIAQAMTRSKPRPMSPTNMT